MCLLSESSHVLRDATGARLVVDVPHVALRMLEMELRGGGTLWED
jgi:hypothetical protein